MKKLIALLAVAGTLAACNNDSTGSSTTDSTGTTTTNSTSTMTTDSNTTNSGAMNSTMDTTSNRMDTAGAGSKIGAALDTAGAAMKSDSAATHMKMKTTTTTKHTAKH